MDDYSRASVLDSSAIREVHHLKGAGKDRQGLPHLPNIWAHGCKEDSCKCIVKERLAWKKYIMMLKELSVVCTTIIIATKTLYSP